MTISQSAPRVLGTMLYEKRPFLKYVSASSSCNCGRIISPLTRWSFRGYVASRSRILVLMIITSRFVAAKLVKLGIMSKRAHGSLAGVTVLYSENTSIVFDECTCGSFAVYQFPASRWYRRYLVPSLVKWLETR